MSEAPQEDPKYGIKLFRMHNKCVGDLLEIRGNESAVYVTGYSRSGVGSYYYDTATATLNLTGTGETYAAESPVKIEEWVATYEDVEAEMDTIDILPQNNILGRHTVDAVYMKTGVANSEITMHKFSDFFTQENEDIETVFNLYNDGQEINSAVATTIFGGSRSNIVHADLPLGSGDQKGFSLRLNATNEARIDDLKILTTDDNIGGDR
jgi:hypothetical protein